MRNIAHLVPAPTALLHRPFASQQRIIIRETAAEVRFCHGQKGLSNFFLTKAGSLLRPDNKVIMSKVKRVYV